MLVCECDGDTEVLPGAAYRGCFENRLTKTAVCILLPESTDKYVNSEIN